MPLALTLKIWRQEDGAASGGWESHRLEGLSPDLSLLEALDLLNDRLVQAGARPVGFDHDCREGICGSCGFLINGQAHGPMAGTSVCQLYLRHFRDGDTLVLRLPSGPPVTVRLRDIDAPEICQPWGVEAKNALAELTLNKFAILTPVARDSFGRMVGRITVEDLDVGRNLVENGHAWSTRGRNDRGPLVKQERMAKALSRGLHGQLPRAVPPWEWRRNQGPCPKV